MVHPSLISKLLQSKDKFMVIFRTILPGLWMNTHVSMIVIKLSYLFYFHHRRTIV